MRSLVLLLFVVVESIACTSASSVGRADVLAPGTWELSPRATLALDGMKRSSSGTVSLPAAEVGIAGRVGLLERIDVGAQLAAGGIPGVGGFSCALDGKLQTLSSPALDSAVDVQLSFSRVGYGGADIDMWGVTLPVLFGWNFSARDQLFFGPRASAQLWTSPDMHPQTVGFVGVVAGLGLRMFPGWELRPEASLDFSPVHWNGLGDNSQRQGLTFLRLGLGISRVP